jgi:SAM-dependent methyltransferase
MSGSTQQHYEHLLAPNYSWMFGQSFDERAREELALMRSLGLDRRLNGLAIDLGCGPGWQSAALADLGASRVLEVDTNQVLLDELVAHAAGRPIEGVLADICALEHLVAPGSAEVVVCMGDTLTHLADRETVRALFVHVFAVLRAGGTFVLTFRDLSNKLKGLDRIIPVRTTDERIMTCILDFDACRVTVTDVIYVRENGVWRMKKGSYEKLRLSPRWVGTELKDCGFNVSWNEPAGRMHAVVADKPRSGS